MHPLAFLPIKQGLGPHAPGHFYNLEISRGAGLEDKGKAWGPLSTCSPLGMASPRFCREHVISLCGHT